VPRNQVYLTDLLDDIRGLEQVPENSLSPFSPFLTFLQEKLCWPIHIIEKQRKKKERRKDGR